MMYMLFGLRLFLGKRERLIDHSRHEGENNRFRLQVLSKVLEFCSERKRKKIVSRRRERKKKIEKKNQKIISMRHSIFFFIT